jgi:hypothetical protein
MRIDTRLDILLVLYCGGVCKVVDDSIGRYPIQ